MTKPVLIDLFCGAGGAGMGYHMAGFDVVGVDIRPQPHYPFTFVHDDAITYLQWLLQRKTLPCHVIHASPPCQHYSKLNRGSWGNYDDHADLVQITRDLLRQTGLPAVIENVETAPLYGAIRLCGEMFGLGVIRHRLFETSLKVREPLHHPHRGTVDGHRKLTNGERQSGPYVGVYGHGDGNGKARGNAVVERWSTAMGINWMTKAELSQSIPPAYTKYVGRRLLEQMK